MADKSKKPDDTNFKQQRLKAWQPILTPGWVIGTFFVVGIVFVVVGTQLKSESDNVVELVHQYDGAGATGQCANLTVGANQSCDVVLTVSKDMKRPIYVYYQLDNFYQNHRRYVKSRSDKQLRGDTLEKSKLSDCDPFDSTPEGWLLNPCGLIANSMFNDTIELLAQKYELNDTDIAWESDIENKFNNPSEIDEKCSKWCTEKNCLENDTSHWEKCKEKCDWNLDGDNMKPAPTDCTGESCPAGSYTKYLWQTYPKIIPKYPFDKKFDCKNGNLYGVKNEHFIVWMRTAGLPNFRKLYARIEPKTGAASADVIPKGTKLIFRITANFAVDNFEGKKYLVLSTTSWFGGKNSFLGIAYIVVGVLCLLLSALFLVKHQMSPRKLGDTRLLRDQ